VRRLLAVVVAAIALVVLNSGSARAEAGSVRIQDGAPNPASITVNSGDTVVISNDDNVEHTIFALGAPQGPPIAPHGAEEYGPFNTGGTAGRFDYRVDSDGPAGVILVRATAATTTSRPTTTTSTTIARTTTTSTTTTIATTTTTSTTSTTTTTSSSASTDSNSTVVVGQDTGKKKSKGLAALGFLLLLAGLGGFVLLTVTSRRRRGGRPS